jgi:hypothetical protein
MSAWLSRDRQWFDFLGELVERAQRVTHVSLVDPPSITDEALQWLNDTRPFDSKFHKWAWLSCFRDVEASLSALGSNLAAVTRKSTTAVTAALRELPGPDPSAEVRQPAIASLQELAQAVGTPAALVAAWQDLLSAVKNEDTARTDLTFYADTFVSLLRTNDRNVVSTVRLINGVLQDGALTRIEALYFLGELDPADDQAWPHPNERAGMTSDERIELCERLLTAEPVEHHHVVWLAFDRAALAAHPGVTVGQISFYEADLIRSAVAAGGAASPLPDELFAGRVTEQEIPEGNTTVLARVDLGTCVESDPPRRAAAIAESLVATAVFRTGPFSFPLWTGLGWFLHVMDGNVVQSSLFIRNEELPGSRDAYEIVGTELGSLAGSVIATGNPDKRTLARLDALRWFHRAQELEPSARLLLDVRVLELIASSIRSTDPKWREYLDNFWRDAWVRHTILWDLFTTARDAARQSIMSSRDFVEGARPDIDGILAGVLTWHGSYRLEPNFPAAVRALPDLARIFSPFSMRGRRIRTLGFRTRDMDALRAWVHETATEWDALLDRTQRCRNALAHGGPINDSVMASASQFAHTLAAFALSEEVEAVVGGGDITSSHQDLANNAREWRARLATETDVAAALDPRPKPDTPPIS